MSALMPILRRSALLRRPEFSLFDSLFDGFAFPNMLAEEKEWLPSIDVSATDKEIIVRAEVPGMEKEDIDVTLTEGLLTIKGEKKHEREEKKENYHRMETHYGEFCRTLKLPGEIETDKVDAKYKDGVLKITIPKSEKAEAKKVKISD